MKHPSHVRLASLIVVLLAMVTQPLLSQEAGGDVPVEESVFSAAELEQLTASIALYPDDLAMQVLMAATYPLEVVQAQRFVDDNPKLSGDELAKAVDEKGWDDSVKALVNVPDVLKRMSDNLEWTQKLGDAVLAQQADVLAAIQRLRQRSQKAGYLKTTEQQKVVVEKETIIIQPVQESVLYVPAYNPTIVFGPWPHIHYPVTHYYHRRYYPLHGHWFFGHPIHLHNVWHHHAHGHGNWHHGHHGGVHVWRHGAGHGAGHGRIEVRHHRRSVHSSAHRAAESWHHNPAHRRGLRYRDAKTARRYKKSHAVKGRSALRGRAGSGLRPEGRTGKLKRGGKLNKERRPGLKKPDAKTPARRNAGEKLGDGGKGRRSANPGGKRPAKKGARERRAKDRKRRIGSEPRGRTGAGRKGATRKGVKVRGTGGLKGSRKI